MAPSIVVRLSAIVLCATVASAQTTSAIQEARSMRRENADKRRHPGSSSHYHTKARVGGTYGFLDGEHTRRGRAL